MDEIDLHERVRLMFLESLLKTGALPQDAIYESRIWADKVVEEYSEQRSKARIVHGCI